MSGSIPVSVVVNTRNEERNIAKCLRSVRDFGEVFVVDSHSPDRTAEIAAEMGAKVVEFRWNGTYPKKKQWGLENLPFTYDWIMHVDADEELYPELVDEIREVMQRGPQHAGYYVSYDYVFSGRVLKHGLRVHKLVLFEHRKGRFLPYDDLEAGSMGELDGHYQPAIDGSVGLLRHRMLHDDHDNLYHYFDRHNRYSDWEAVVRTKRTMGNPAESRLPHHRLMKRAFDAAPLKPLLFFAYSYIIRLGILDGRAGLRYALAQTVYFWQVGLKMDELRQRGATPGPDGAQATQRPAR